MRTPASVRGHPVHAILVPLPIGLWIFALVCDVLAQAIAGPEWPTVGASGWLGGEMV